MDHYNSSGLYIDRWTNYFYPYVRHFDKWRGNKVVMLEIGVQSGGSTNMWPDFLGAQLQYFGFDIYPNCSKFTRDGVTIFIGDQNNPADLDKLKSLMPNPDIIIDDGGHMMNQQMTSFNHLFPFLKHGGVYLIEDLHTSYYTDYGGTADLTNTSIDTGISMSKTLVDVLHLKYLKDRGGKGYWPKLDWQYLHSKVGGIMFYDSMVFIEKTKVRPHTTIQRGKIQIPNPFFGK